MSSNLDKINTIVENYISVMLGSEIINALKLHASKAGVNVDYIKWEGIEKADVYKVFQAAYAQFLLDDLISVVEKEGFPIAEHSGKTKTEYRDHSTQFDVSQYRKWLLAETEYVDIRGIGERSVESPIVFPLMKLYTDLYVQIGLSNFDLDQGRIRGRKRIKLTEMMSNSRCLAIIGDPGSGKTTFLRYVARKQLLKEDMTLPFLLRLGEVYEFIQDNNLKLAPDVLIEYLYYLGTFEKFNLDPSELNTKCNEGKCLWLLDSLDELPSETAREEMVSVIEKASRLWDKCNFVITSRPLAIKGMSIPLGFEVVGIDNWGKEEIQSFLEAWTILLYPDFTKEMQRRHWGGLLSTILDNPELQSLSKNAVMVTAMAVVHYNEKRLPEGRADLLEALIYWLVRARSRSISVGYSSPKFIEGIYRGLALSMFEADKGPKNMIGRMWAAEKISRYFDDNVEKALEFLGREETETGVLVRRRVGDLAFWHLSFQEYLAAKEIAGKTDDPVSGWWAKIERNLDRKEWREVLIFVPACLHRLGGERVDLFFERLGNSCKQDKLNIKAKRVALGGSVLRDLRLSGYKIDFAPAWEEVLTSVYSLLFEKTENNLSLDTRFEAAVAYGLGGDDRLREETSNWIRISSDDIVVFGAQADDPDSPGFDEYAAAWEGPTFKAKLLPFEMKKYLVVVEEFQKFVEDGGYEDYSESLWNKKGWKWRIDNNINLPLDWDEQILYPNCPVTGISWFEADAYCNWLSVNDMRDIVYRLPCEFEWEFAAKRGTPVGQRFLWGDTMTKGDQAEANWGGCYLRRKTPVGMFPKSTTVDGIADLIGNVEEWCIDTWVHNYKNLFTNSTNHVSPRVVPEEYRRVVRGGSTIRFSRLCRPTYRGRIPEHDRYLTVGFRLVRDNKK